MTDDTRQLGPTNWAQGVVRQSDMHISLERLSNIVSDKDYSKIGQTTLSAKLDSNLDADELHMRETLGIGGRGRGQIRTQPSSAPKQRHRFVQDGEVQVIHLSGQRDGDSVATSRGRIASLEAALEAEQAARAKAEQSAQAAMGQVHALETKLAHVEMAAREVTETERQLRLHAESELQLAIVARDSAQDLLAQSSGFAAAPQVNPPVVKQRAKSTPRVAKAKVPRVKEPKPVKWWLAKSAIR